MLYRITKWAGACAIALFTIAATPSHAVTLNCVGANNGQNLDATLDTALMGACVTGENDDGANGYFSNNPTVFGVDGWIKSDKDIDNSPNGPIFFTQSVGVGDSSGTWSINGFAGYTNVAIALKAGRSFGLFLLDTSAGTTGTWSTSRDLSHATIWIQGQPVIPAVPLPASALFLLAGIAGFAGMRRKI